MLRFLSAGAVLLVAASTVASAAASTAASTAAASEHYVEIWNPPEARIGQPAAKCKPRSGKTALLARGTGKAAPRRIADRLAKASTGKHAGGDAARKATSPRFIDIPRIMTPEGNVLQVGTGRMAVNVVR